MKDYEKFKAIKAITSSRERNKKFGKMLYNYLLNTSSQSIKAEEFHQWAIKHCGYNSNGRKDRNSVQSLNKAIGELGGISLDKRWFKCSGRDKNYTVSLNTQSHKYAFANEREHTLFQGVNEEVEQKLDNIITDIRKYANDPDILSALKKKAKEIIDLM
jgi:hypothetical protein